MDIPRKEELLKNSWFLHNFPNLRLEDFEVTSPETPIYNCFAWAQGKTNLNIWPRDLRDSQNLDQSWPAEAPQERTIHAIEWVLFSERYKPCINPALENRYEKLALYHFETEPRHVARQLPDGKWTSKLGQDIDILHKNLEGLFGPMYGNQINLYRRIRTTF